MSNVLIFGNDLGKNDVMNNNTQEQREYLTQSEMFTDLKSVLVLESKVLAEQLNIIINFDELEVTPVSNDFEVLHNYVYKRIWDGTNLPKKQDLIHRVFGFLARIEQAESWEIFFFTAGEMKPHARLKQLVDTAEAYRCLEEDEALTLKHAVLLTGMGEASIRNAASKGEISFDYFESYPGVTFLEDGNISVVDWVTSRTGYRHQPDALSTTSTEVVRVPFASDGSYFSPGCRMRKGFQIGKRDGKGVLKQRYISDYWSALKELSKMEEVEKSYWRRPSPFSGVPSTVTGRSWGSVDRAMLEEQLDII
jgi:hypothetical protein